jgi:hypothetical protein
VHEVGKSRGLVEGDGRLQMRSNDLRFCCGPEPGRTQSDVPLLPLRQLDLLRP